MTNKNPQNGYKKINTYAKFCCEALHMLLVRNSTTLAREVMKAKKNAVFAFLIFCDSKRAARLVEGEEFEPTTFGL